MTIKRQAVWVPVMLGIAFSVLAATQLRAQSEKGAKSLFYNPTNSELVSAPASSSAQPPANAKQRKGTGRSSAHRQSSLGLKYWVELIQGGTAVRATASHAFHSDDQIRFHFESNADGYITLIGLGSSGKAQILFPSKKTADNFLAKGKEEIVPPPAANPFKFDRTTGEETVYVFFAKKAEDVQISPADAADRARAATGSKDLIVEEDEQAPSEVGVYAVNLKGDPVVMQIKLQHE